MQASTNLFRMHIDPLRITIILSYKKNIVFFVYQTFSLKF